MTTRNIRIETKCRILRCHIACRLPVKRVSFACYYDYGRIRGKTAKFRWFIRKMQGKKPRIEIINQAATLRNVWIFIMKTKENSCLLWIIFFFSLLSYFPYTHVEHATYLTYFIYYVILCKRAGETSREKKRNRQEVKIVLHYKIKRYLEILQPKKKRATEKWIKLFSLGELRSKIIRRRSMSSMSSIKTQIFRCICSHVFYDLSYLHIFRWHDERHRRCHTVESNTAKKKASTDYHYYHCYCYDYWWWGNSLIIISNIQVVSSVWMRELCISGCYCDKTLAELSKIAWTKNK